jgi:hypothetical protein
VHVELSPEPSPEERAALLRALDGLVGPTRPVSAWWEAGIRESVEDEQEPLPLRVPVATPAAPALTTNIAGLLGAAATGLVALDGRLAGGRRSSGQRATS